MKQQTLRKEYSFQGKGLHTGRMANVTLKPAPVDTGIVFVRTDLGKSVPALGKYVSSTSRSTLIENNGAKVGTIEHVLAALTGLGVDNAYIHIDSREMPILDGSAKPYVQAILPDGLEQQEADRKWIEVKEEVIVKNAKSGSWIKIEPADELSYEVTIDFDSRVLGIQSVSWDRSKDFATEVAPCRTFCFLHEIQHLLMLGLVKGGDLENAIVIVERPIGERAEKRLAKRFGQNDISVTSEGYLNNVDLHFKDECGRHKLLDIIGDMRLSGGFLKAKITAYKPGHKLNTAAALKINTIYG